MARNLRKLIREGKVAPKDPVKCRVCLDTGVAWAMGGVVGLTRFCVCSKGGVARGSFVAKMEEQMKRMMGMASKLAEGK